MSNEKNQTAVMKMETHHPNGNIKTRYQFVNGDKHGVQYEYDVNGDLAYEYNYENGEREGKGTGFYSPLNPVATIGKGSEYDKDGLKDSYLEISRKYLKKFEKHYVHGERHGTSKAWYPDGTLHYELEYSDAKRHGVHKGFRPDGTIEYEYHYWKGKRNGDYILYNQDGSIQSKRTYQQGKQIVR